LGNYPASNFICRRFGTLRLFHEEEEEQQQQQEKKKEKKEKEKDKKRYRENIQQIHT
jgi:predicted DNA-binding WGR domain protein